MPKTKVVVAALVASLGLAACVVAPVPNRVAYYPDGGAAIVTEVAPPAPYVEAIPPVPYAGALWIGGYWGWRGNRHYWVPGRWEHPRAGYMWAPRRWDHRHGRWELRGGGWVRR